MTDDRLPTSPDFATAKREREGRATEVMQDTTVHRLAMVLALVGIMIASSASFIVIASSASILATPLGFLVILALANVAAVLLLCAGFVLCAGSVLESAGGRRGQAPTPVPERDDLLPDPSAESPPGCDSSNAQAAGRSLAEAFAIVVVGALCSMMTLVIVVDLPREVIVETMATAGVLVVAAVLAVWRSRTRQKNR